jgi:hypothetical protein
MLTVLLQLITLPVVSSRTVQWCVEELHDCYSQRITGPLPIISGDVGCRWCCANELYALRCLHPPVPSGNELQWQCCGTRLWLCCDDEFLSCLVTIYSTMTNRINFTACVVTGLNWLRWGNYNVLLNTYCSLIFVSLCCESYRCHFYRVWQVTGYCELFVIFFCQCTRTPVKYLDMGMITSVETFTYSPYKVSWHFIVANYT